MRGALGSAMEQICPDSDQTKDKRSWQNSTTNLEKFIRRTKVALPEIGLSGRHGRPSATFFPPPSQWSLCRLLPLPWMEKIEGNLIAEGRAVQHLETTCQN